MYNSSLNALILFISLVCLNVGLDAQEICFNRIDDDGDGMIDCSDSECYDASSCWQCQTEFYQVHSNTTLVSLDPASGIYNVIGSISGASQVNGAQFNHIDGHVYAPCFINGQHKLGVLSQDGTVSDTGLVLPGNGIFYAGAISGDGKMYLSSGAGIHMVDLAAENLSVVSTGLPHPGVADFALDITNGMFYGIAGGGTLKVFDPYALTVNSYQLAGSIVSDGGGFGAAWSCIDGSFFAYNNSSGKIYSVNVNDLTATQVLNATGNLSINDGFNCVMSPPPFETKCNNGADDDGDGFPDCDDPDCFNSNTCIIEICDNGMDDDLDGWADCDDSECQYLEWCVEICDNGIDDNGNGFVDGQDSQCSTQSGVLGGLESNPRLADKISLRNYKRNLESKDIYRNKNAGLIPFEHREFKSEVSIADFIPDEMWDAYVAESSPTDLTEITNANVVASADYYLNDVRVGTVLGIESDNKVYEHSKYICDRSEGARLIDVSYLYAYGGNLITYELLSKEGRIEYAVSFSAYESEGGFSVASHWDINEFEEESKYYNFQIWAKSNAELIDLVEAVLSRIDDKGTLQEINTSPPPMVFINHVSYKNGALNLRIRNKNHSPSVSVSGMMKTTETGEAVEFNASYDLSGAQEEWVRLDSGHIYDFGLSLNVETGTSDEVFIADGAWGIDVDPNFALLQDFQVNDEEEVMEGDVLQIERDIVLEASVKDYVNVYRALGPKFLAQDIQAFNSLVFEAKGSGTVRVSLVKASIDNWSDQFKTTIQLKEENGLYVLHKGMFTSTYGDQLDFGDLTMLVFSVMGDRVSYENKSFELGSVRFENRSIEDIPDYFVTNGNLVSPNPVKDVLKISGLHKFPLAKRVIIYSAEGKSIGTYGIPEEGIFEIDMENVLPGMYIYNLEGASGTLFSGKFIKL